MAATVIELFEKTASRWGPKPAMRYKRDGEWLPITWSRYRELVSQAARGFMELGLETGRGVAIIGFNRPEWFVADLAAIAAGGVPAGIYTTCTDEQCHYIAHHCEAPIVVVENKAQLEKFLRIRDRLPNLRALVLMEGSSDEPHVYSWDELLALGASASEDALRERVSAQRADDLCTLIYTSGTTGPPKAVMLSHNNMIWTAGVVVEHLGIGQPDQFLSYLPLSHIAEQMISLHGPLSVGACVWFAESIEKLPQNLGEVRPHVFFGVPRVWEKIQAAIVAAAAANSGLKKKVAGWARRQGLAAGYADQEGRRPPLAAAAADKLLLSKVRAKLGLDRARICACGAAPITLDTLEFFLSLGIPILEVYGMSEVTGPGTISSPERYRTGRAGFVIPGSEIRIAGDGEILMRGPHVFLGYFKDPETTAETLDGDGWVHSGDVGTLDDDGFLRITDRKKELIITSGGKNVAPAPIEARLKAIPAVALAVVIGERRNYLTALITLDPETLPSQAEAAGSPARDLAQAATCEIFNGYLERQIEAVNAELASYETIKRFKILPVEFGVDGGELTPTLKLKRRVIYEKFAPEIGELYPAR